MKYLLFLFAITGCHVDVWSQNRAVSTITVLGRDNYNESPEAYGIKVLFEENPNKCDPVIGFLTLEDQFSRFGDELSKKGIDFRSFTALPDDPNLGTKHKLLKFTHKSPETILQISEVCRIRAVQVQGTFTVFAEEKFEDQDVRSINALNDAQQKAAFLAKRVNKKVGNILNIDDDTSLALFDSFDLGDTENAEAFVDLLSLFSSFELLNKESNEWTKSGAYTILVTFELR